jgi:putative Holliday junction resolvase
VTDDDRARGRVLALDHGTVRIGVAVCNADRSIAVPLASVPAAHDAADRCAVIAKEESAVAVVVGLPLRLDGSPGDAAASASGFADELRRSLGAAGIEVVLFDERLTTVTASARLRDAGVPSRRARGRVDSAAAVVLLEAWLAR